MDTEFLFLALGLAALFAGFVDSIVGGGGLIQLPALFAAFPNTAPATLFGTNKLASIVGTTSAAIQYSRRVEIPWRVAGPGAVAALVGSWYGAKAVAYLDPAILRPLIRTTAQAYVTEKKLTMRNCAAELSAAAAPAPAAKK